jgi:hypothetical protein
MAERKSVIQQKNGIDQMKIEKSAEGTKITLYLNSANRSGLRSWVQFVVFRRHEFWRDGSKKWP